MSKIISEYALKPGYRVVLMEIDYDLPYQISSQQHYTTHADRPHDDHDENGWRNCTTVFAKSREEAGQKFQDMIRSEKRWFS